jgi:hypothetical protein
MTRNEYNTLPRRARGLLMVTGLLALFQAGAAFQVLHIPGTLAAQISLSLPLEFTASLLWAFLAGVDCIQLWRRRAGAQKNTVWLLIAFMIYTLLRLILFAQADYDRGRLGFLTLVFVLIIALIALRSSLFRKRHSTEMIEK